MWGSFLYFSEEGLTDFSLNYQLLERFCSYQWIQTAVLRGAGSLALEEAQMGHWSVSVLEFT